jgi:polysaccharide pyruvyl transferase WcaK-like protein
VTGHKILIYGTIANALATPHSPSATSWKMRVRAALDRFLYAAGSTAQLDYRNYDVPYATNRGDIAIAEAVRNQLRLAINDVTFTNLNWGELDQLDQDEISNGFSLIVVAGSGYFHFSANGELGDRVARDLQFWERLNSPIVLYGIGVNRLIPLYSDNESAKMSAANDALLRRILASMALIGVRSADSQEELAICSDKPVRLVCDPALFLAPYKTHENRGIVAGIYAAPRIGVNFAFHGPLSTEILKQNLPAYVQILRTLHAETGCSYHYFIHNHTEWIIPHLLRDQGLKVETVSGDPYMLVRHYADMNIHLGGMLHSSILASGVGTPCVLLAYDAKHFGFAQRLGMESHCHMATTLDSQAVLRSMRNLLQNEAEIRRALAERLSQLWNEQKRFVRDCAALIHTNSGKQ